MIENIRKYTGLMIVVLVLLFIGLVFLGDNVGNSFSGKPVMEVAGRGISQKEFQRNAIDVQKIASELPVRSLLPRETRVLASHYLGEDIIETPYANAQSILQQMSIYLQPSDRLPTRFLANRIAVQKAGLEYGVTPSDEEVESFVENVVFADDEGNFNQEASREFFDEKAGKLGIGTRGFNEYIRDLMTAQNLSKLIGGGIAPEMETVRALYDSSQQKITVKQVSLNSAKFEAEANPTEEEIKAYYEENKENYNSDEQRKVSYLFVEPDWKAKLEEVEKKKAEEAKKKADEEAKLKAQAEEAKKAAEKANAEKESNGEETGETEPPAPTEDTPTEDAPTEDTPTEDTPTEDAPTEEGSQGQTGEPGEPAPTEEPAPAKEPATPEATEDTKTEEAPTEPAKPVEKAPAPEAETGEKEEEKPAAKTDEPVAPTTPLAPKKPAPTIAQSPKDKLTPAERQEAVNALNPKLTEFDDIIVDSLGKDFEKAAGEFEFEILKSELFTQADAPKPFNTRVTSDAVGSLADATFKLPVDGSLDERITAPYQTADGWFVIRLDEVVKSRPLTFEEAKSKVTADLKKKMARELLAKKAKELHEKLAAGVKEGKSFTDLAKESEYPAVDLPDVAQRMNPTTFEAAQYTAPGEVAPLKLAPTDENPDRALIILVEKREVIKDEAYQTGLESAFKGQSNITRYIAFQNWLYDQYLANNVKVAESE